VDYFTEDGTAKEGKDYFKKAGTLIFGPNVTRFARKYFLNRFLEAFRGRYEIK